MKSAPAIGFDYRPSRFVAASAGLVWLFALLALAVCGLPAWSKGVLAVVASVYAAWALRDFLRRSFDHVFWHEAGHWRMSKGDELEQAAELLHAMVLGGVIVLSFRVASIGKVSVMLLPDNCEADTRRRLRVRLARVRAGGDQHA
jgi:toxin CptA